MKTKNSVTLFVVLVLFCGADVAFCDTSVQGTIDGEHWTKAGSPYWVDGDIWVVNNGLTIDPGVRVEFQGDFFFKIQTTSFSAAGTGSEHITFTWDGINGWHGIIFDSAAAGGELINCDISHSNYCGIKIVNSRPVIEWCTIESNISSDGAGGGLHIFYDSAFSTDLVLKNCIIANNTAATHGGGVYADISSGSLEFDTCEINDNLNSKDNGNGNFYGGGVYIESGDVTFSDCVINDNQARSKNTNFNGSAYCYGGGVFVNQGSVSFHKTTIASNTTYAYAYYGSSAQSNYAYSYGAGIYLNSGVSAVLKNCEIKSNSPTAYGRNGSYYHGGGVFVHAATAFVENCSVAFNMHEGIFNSGGILNVRNSIVYYNNDDQIAGTATVNYSNVEGGYTTGVGNIDVDPEFVNPPIDLSLRSTSPCIDAGDPNPVYNDLFFPPSQGTEINDMGYTGGPGPQTSTPRPDVKVNGMDGNVIVTEGTMVEVTVSIDPGDEAGTKVDLWMVVVSHYNLYWLQSNGIWTPSATPVLLKQGKLERRGRTTVLDSALPRGSFIVSFIIDDKPNSKFDSAAWCDDAVVTVIP